MSVCGLDGAGKTTIINYLVKGEFVETIPTLGINRETIDFPKLKLNVFDLGGQIDFRGMWNQVNEKADALVFVIDSTDTVRLNEAKEIFHNIVDLQINDDIPVLILLNKIDIPYRISRSDFINEFDLANFASEMTWTCYETSAKTGEGIFDAFSWFIQMLKEV
ncbi:MAG: GTP-binding protein [Asgard group archaeon]|nr:GTP-binding protein [Asgard group archaeon]